MGGKTPQPRYARAETAARHYQHRRTARRSSFTGRAVESRRTVRSSLMARRRPVRKSPAYDVLFQIVAGKWNSKRGVSGPSRMLTRLVLLAIALSTSSSARAESVFTSRPDDPAAV